MVKTVAAPMALYMCQLNVKEVIATHLQSVV